ncbi:MAG: glutamine synthetase [Clostridia bacterium]|nr:glutamine synthetase [Clostridia bacterium]
MKYSPDEIMQFIAEEDVKFIRLAFCDIYGNQKNVSIMPNEIERAFKYGISIDASAVADFNCGVHSDLFLRPDASTICVLPWRPEHGKVVRMFCDITYQNGDVFELDTRNILKKAIKDAKEKGYSFKFGTEMEFYLFEADEKGNKTDIPFDNAGYMDIAPADKGENVRRDICLTLEKMGIESEGSHHQTGPGQNEIDFKYSDPLTCADNAITFKYVVNTISVRHGVCADFSPKPIADEAGNGMHINISVDGQMTDENINYIIGGIIKRISDITVFLNRVENSYLRFGTFKAPKYVSWSKENRSQLIRVPAAPIQNKRVELRSPDAMCNPYIAYSLLIYAVLEGFNKKLAADEAINKDLFYANDEEAKGLKSLLLDLNSAKNAAKNSDFVKKYLPSAIIEKYCE